VSKAKPYHVCITGLAEGEKLGHITVYLKSDFEVLQNKLATITSDRDAEKSMKAKAREQRDKVTKQLSAAQQRNLDLLKVIRANHEWHVLYDDHEGYFDSALYGTNRDTLNHTELETSE
jgi:hypothetical protein